MQKAILVVILVAIIAAAAAGLGFQWWKYAHRDTIDDPSTTVNYRGRSLRNWLDDLKAPDVEVRRQAAEGLMDLPARDGKIIIGALVNACADDDNLTRCRAATAVGRITSEVSIPAPLPLGQIIPTDLTPPLHDDDPNIRCLAAEAFGSFGPRMKPAIPLLTEVAKDDKDEAVRKAATSALEKIRPPAKARTTQAARATQATKADTKASGSPPHP
jgi:HEAT repeat protein